MNIQPVPAPICHFTHIRNLGGIVAGGLVCDDGARKGLTQTEIGDVGIKASRRARPVPISPGGTVSEYVPFYFAIRSPMLFSIHKGNVPTYQGGCDELVYLVSSLESLTAAGLAYLVTDRNAALATADFRSGADGPSTHVDWPLMRERMWANTEEDPERKERRMAECLVHRLVPWAAIEQVGVKSQAVAERARRILGAAGQVTPVIVVPRWYF